MRWVFAIFSRSKRLLDEHTRVHTGDIPFFCTNCSKTFSTGSGLKQHHRRHESCRLATTAAADPTFGVGSVVLDVDGSGLVQPKPAGIILPESESVLLAESILTS